MAPSVDIRRYALVLWLILPVMRYAFPTGGGNQARSLTKKMVKGDCSKSLSLDLKIEHASS